MIVYYFGADAPWIEQNESNIRRRNMAILQAIAQNEQITKIYNIIRTQRASLGKKSKTQSSEHPKIENVFIAPILPERGILNYLRPLNSFLLKYMNRKVFKQSAHTKQIAWCYWPKGFEDFQLLNLSMDMVFDTDHNIIHDPNVVAEQRAKIEQQLTEIGHSAKMILSSSRSMLEWYHNNEFSNTELLLNGVFADRINSKPTTKSKESYQVTYCGTLSKWMKLDWLLQIIEEKPDWKFTFIGDNYKSEVSSKLEHFSNVELLGYLEPKEVDFFIRQSNVCLGLYQKESALDVNSMKLYDYLAQGVPVVVNDYHPNLSQDFGECLNIAATYEEFKSLLEAPKSINEKQLEAFLNGSTWNQRVNPILDKLIA